MIDRGLKRVSISSDPSSIVLPDTAYDIEGQVFPGGHGYLVGIDFSFNNIIPTGGTSPTITTIDFGVFTKTRSANGAVTNAPYVDVEGTLIRDGTINPVSFVWPDAAASNNVTSHFIWVPGFKTDTTSYNRVFGGLVGLPVGDGDTIVINDLTFTSTGSPTAMSISAMSIQALIQVG